MELAVLLGIFLVIFLFGNSSRSTHGSYDYLANKITPNRNYKPLRSTHCHSCGTQLKSISEEECSECGWLICPNCDSCKYSCKGFSDRRNEKVFNALGNQEKAQPQNKISVQKKRQISAPKVDRFSSCDDFMHFVPSKVKCRQELTKYERHIIEKFTSHISSSEPFCNALKELHTTGKYTSSPFVSELAEFLIIQATRKQTAWWETINRLYYGSNVYTYKEEDDFLADQLAYEEELASNEESYEKRQFENEC